MVNSVPANWGKGSPTGWLQKRRARRARHPETFDCGVRVIDGALAGESDRWRYRISAADPLIAEGVVALNHGPDVTLRLVVDPVPSGAGRRPGHLRLTAVERGSGARVELSVSADELERFGLEPG
jgi:hypothetical protein